MSFSKDEILQLSPDEKRTLAFELLDSIDEEFVNQPVPEWKKRLIEERIYNDLKNPADVTSWEEVRKKYYGQ
jgi:putative addiction module component (TIGR02574 family)